MKSYLDFGGSEALARMGALLLYECRNRAFVVWHDAKAGVGEGAWLPC
jgi:hypothetical protein